MRTMKTMRRLMSLAAAFLTLSACSETEDLLSSFHSDPSAVRVKAEVGKASASGFTRSNPLGDTEEQKRFNAGDEISVKADGQEAVTYRLVGSEWQPQGDKYLKWESETMNFTACYPATYGGGTPAQPTEYTSEASLAAADCMSYVGSQSNTNGNNLTLTMERRMARVVVEIVGFNDQYASGTTVSGVTVKGVKAYRHTDGKFYALMVPCEADATAQFLSLAVGEGNAVETLKGVPALEAGKSYTYQLTVGKNKISVTGVSVADWTTGTIEGGKATIVPYVTFTAAGNQTFMMTTTGDYDLSGKFEYSVNGGAWQPVEEDQEVSFGGASGTLRLRGTSSEGTATGGNDYSTITFADDQVKVACTGDIRTLQNYDNYKTVETGNARFCRLFEHCEALTSAPALPATTLADNCYSFMFIGCTSLVNAPELPATTLADNCYTYMFNGCTSLVNAPELPATTLAGWCCLYMFGNCTSLKKAPALPATTLAVGCYYFMFNKCTSLVDAPELPATTLADRCYYAMFYGCSSLVNAPELPATTLAYRCYQYMFYNCKSLTSVTMLAPSGQINNNSFSAWLYYAGTKDGISRTLKVEDADAYNALKDLETDCLPENWQTGQCTVKDSKDNPIQ